MIVNRHCRDKILEKLFVMYVRKCVWTQAEPHKVIVLTVGRYIGAQLHGSSRMNHLHPFNRIASLMINEMNDDLDRFVVRMLWIFVGNLWKSIRYSEVEAGRHAMAIAQ